MNFHPHNVNQEQTTEIHTVLFRGADPVLLQFGSVLWRFLENESKTSIHRKIITGKGGKKREKN